MQALKVNQTYEEAIIELYLQNFRPRKIRFRLGVGFTRIRNTINFYEENGTVPDPKCSGRPSKSTEATLAAIEALTINNGTLSSYDISQKFKNDNIELSTTSVWRYRHKLNFNFKPPKQRQALNQDQIKNRLIFSHSIVESNLDLSRIVFSDECRFCLGSDNSWIWYRRGDRSDNVFAIQKSTIRASCFTEL